MVGESDIETAVEILNETPWLDDFRDEGKIDGIIDITNVVVDTDGIVVRGHEKFGSGQRPYSEDPSHHVELLNHPTFHHGEGTVVYKNESTDGVPLRLPKHAYFEKRIDFERIPRTIDDLENLVSESLGFDVPVEEIVTEFQGESPRL